MPESLEVNREVVTMRRRPWSMIAAVLIGATFELGACGPDGVEQSTCTPYLAMTPALLHEACQLFEKYAEGTKP